MRIEREPVHKGSRYCNTPPFLGCLSSAPSVADPRRPTGICRAYLFPYQLLKGLLSLPPRQLMNGRPSHATVDIMTPKATCKIEWCTVTIDLLDDVVATCPLRRHVPAAVATYQPVDARASTRAVPAATLVSVLNINAPWTGLPQLVSVAFPGF